MCVLAGSACYLIAVGLTAAFYLGIFEQQDEDVRAEVVAHRCGANYAPENTVAALNKAADKGATWCEIDVQQCADGAIIVIHDTNLKRITDLDANTWEVTYDQVKQLDAGSSFSEEYANEPLPLLSGMIETTKARGMKLQIEVKPTGNGEGIEQRTVDIVRQANFQDQCVLASQDFACIEKLRACAPDVQILYIMSLAYGDVPSIPQVDHYSVEATWATNALVDNVHGKRGRSAGSLDRQQRVGNSKMP